LTVPRAFGYPLASGKQCSLTDGSAGCDGQKGSLAPAIGRQDANQSSFFERFGVGRPQILPQLQPSRKIGPGPPRSDFGRPSLT
jgi:hypothetical protein